MLNRRDLLCGLGTLPLWPNLSASALTIGTSEVISVSDGNLVLPGAMFMIATIRDVPVLGTPACGLFHEVTVLDLILPRVLAGDRITETDIALLGHGGLCMNCETCVFPHCPFGKGS